jgi:hypothetical protein
MSAINQQPSLIDRAGELRTDPAMLDELLKRAKVLSVGGGKVSANLASAKLVYPNAQSDENYFLGIDRATDTPYFFAKGFKSGFCAIYVGVFVAYKPLEVLPGKPCLSVGSCNAIFIEVEIVTLA